MAPEDRFLPRFAAEPPQDPLPYGRWEQRLRDEFLSAALALEVSGHESSPTLAIARAAQASDQGAAAELLARLARFGAEETLRIGGA